ncbi:NADPH-dependent glutamate synthase [Oscillospiraceae bacterium CM]|nr:NADPH-dependent glutamate synthase [Oscillospiraceae bacterium CM]
MANMDKKKTPIPEQEPQVRNKNFEEVALGYTEEMAKNEAARCLNCKNKPCVEGCPVNVRIPEFIGKISEGDYEAAYEILTSTNSLPAVCGRVCPQESQCEAKCVRGIKGEPVGIGRLERFAADRHITCAEKKACPTIQKNGVKVAVVGSGPAGLTCAGDLAMNGFDVTVFESLHDAGGVLIYGIPEFRLPKSIVKKEVEQLQGYGITIKTDMVIGKTMTIDELFADGYEAVFIGSGAGLPQFLNIEGESLLGVYSANEYLTRINLMKSYKDGYDTPAVKSKRVAVVGGGNVAMDAARCAQRMGAEKVYIIYRRSMDELPARSEEVHHAIEEGIEFQLLRNPVKIIGDENSRVVGIECVEMELGEPDASGRRRPIAKEGSNFVIDVDTVIISVGTSPNPLIKSTTKGLEANKHGCLVADENGATTREGVFAGGDAVTGAATVILAAGAGKTAASAMMKYLEEKKKK